MKILGFLVALAALLTLLLFLLLGGSSEREREEQSFLPGQAARAAEETVAAEPAPAADDGQSAPTGRVAQRAPKPKRGPARAPEAPRQQRSIQGTVVGGEGPLQSAMIVLMSAGEVIARAQPDRIGKFELVFDVPAVDTILRVSARGYATLERDLGTQQIAGTQHMGNLFVRRGTVLAGVVENEAGQPVRGATVQLSTLRGRSIAPGVGEQTKTGPDGRFEFPWAPDGPVILTARAEGLGERTIDHRHRPGHEARLVLARGLDLTLRVLDEKELPVEDMQLTIRTTDPGSPPRVERTDGEGRATFAGLNAPDWNVRTSLAGFKPAGIASVTAGGDEVVVRVVRWPCVTGRLRVPDGQSLPDEVRLHALPTAARGDMLGRLPGGTLAEEGGRFRVCDLRPGEYRLHAFAAGFADTASRPFRVGDVGDVDLGNLLLQSGGSLELVLQASGKPAAGVRGEVLLAPPVPTQLWAGPRSREQEVTSDAEGRLRLENLVPGSVWILLRGDDVVPKSIGPIAIANGSTTRPSPVALLPGARIRGHVRLADGQAVARARIKVQGREASIPFLTSEADGSFETLPLPPGVYVVQATSVRESDLFDNEPLEVRLASGEDARAELVLSRSDSSTGPRGR